MPLVLLAYSICGFIIGAMAYAIIGNVVARPTNFGRLTGWIIIGVWIGLAAILAASTVLMKMIS